MPSRPPDLKAIKGIVFDLDDTLYPQVEYKRSGFRAVSNWVSEKYKLNQLVILNELEKILEQFGPSYPFMFDRLAERLDLPETLVPQVVRVFIDHEPQISCYEGVIPLLERLKRRYRLGILTDGRLAVQQKKVRALGLESRIERILFSDTQGLEKPALALFRWFENRFGLRGEQLMYVGDNPQKDFWGANRCGWETIQVKTGAGQNTVGLDGFMAKLSIQSVIDIEFLLQSSIKRNVDS